MRRRPFTARIKAAAVWKRLTELNRSQAWLARKAGITPGYLSLLIAGRRHPSGQVRQRIQDALGIDDFYELFAMEVEYEDHA